MSAISKNIIEKALERCIDIFKWPPEIAEFKEFCMSIKRNHFPDDVVDAPVRKKLDQTGKIINEGAKICAKIKEIYPELNWYQIANKFTLLKKKSKTFYPDHSELEIMSKLYSYPNEDIKDMINLEKI